MNRRTFPPSHQKVHGTYLTGLTPLGYALQPFYSLNYYEETDAKVGREKLRSLRTTIKSHPKEQNSSSSINVLTPTFRSIQL